MKTESLILVIILIYTLGLQACIKDELTEPALVTFEFSMETSLPDGKFLKFDNGDLELDAVEFEGDREAGEDIYFLSTFDDKIEVDLDQMVANQMVSYDIPQGVYKRIKLRLGREELDDGPGIVYTGVYSSNRNGDIPVRIEFSDIEPIELIGENTDPNMDIVLNKEKATIARIKFDPNFLFQVSNSRQLESADISMVNDEPIIIISKDSNSVIFNIIVNRLERSVSAIFE